MTAREEAWLVPRLPHPCGQLGGGRELGALILHLWPPLATEHPPLPSQPFTRQEVIGFVIGSVSSVLYLFSRLPQIRTNVSHVQGGGPWRGGRCGSSSFWVGE